VSNSTQYKLFIGDDKKYMLFGMTFSFKDGPHQNHRDVLISFAFWSGS